MQLYFLRDFSPPDSDLVTTTLALGLIRKAHIHESVLKSDGLAVNPDKLRVIARMGGTTYARVREGFDLERTSWKTAKSVYEDMLRRQD